MQQNANEQLIVPYNDEIAQTIFSKLFRTDIETEQGITEIPADSYQLVVSALDLIRWELSGDDREIIKKATEICEWLRDKQKMREWNRRGARHSKAS